MKAVTKHIPLLAVLGLAIGLSCSPRAYAAENLNCKLAFEISGWSLVYKHATGTGTVTCTDGKTMPVNIKAQALGITAGKWAIHDGTGKFSNIHKIEDVLGGYVQGEANIGAGKSGTAQVLTKGTVSLALAGAGEGINVGVDIGRFELSRP